MPPLNGDHPNYNYEMSRSFEAISNETGDRHHFLLLQYGTSAYPEKTLESLPLVFQPGQSEGLNKVYHFSFTGDENLEGTVTIREKTLTVQDGLEGRPDLHVTADSQASIKFLAKEMNLVKALATRKIKIKGSPKLMMAFAKCFPS